MPRQKSGLYSESVQFGSVGFLSLSKAFTSEHVHLLLCSIIDTSVKNKTTCGFDFCAVTIFFFFFFTSAASNSLCGNKQELCSQRTNKGKREETFQIRHS